MGLILALVFHCANQAMQTTKRDSHLLHQTLRSRLIQVAQALRQVNEIMRLAQGISRDIEEVKVFALGLA